MLQGCESGGTIDLRETECLISTALDCSSLLVLHDLCWGRLYMLDASKLRHILGELIRVGTRSSAHEPSDRKPLSLVSQQRNEAILTTAKQQWLIRLPVQLSPFFISPRSLVDFFFFLLRGRSRTSTTDLNSHLTHRHLAAHRHVCSTP